MTMKAHNVPNLLESSERCQTYLIHLSGFAGPCSSFETPAAAQRSARHQTSPSIPLPSPQHYQCQHESPGSHPTDAGIALQSQRLLFSFLPREHDLELPPQHRQQQRPASRGCLMEQLTASSASLNRREADVLASGTSSIHNKI